MKRFSFHRLTLPLDKTFFPAIRNSHKLNGGIRIALLILCVNGRHDQKKENSAFDGFFRGHSPFAITLRFPERVIIQTSTGRMKGFSQVLYGRSKG